MARRTSATAANNSVTQPEPGLPDRSSVPRDRLVGLMLVGITTLVMLAEWTGQAGYREWAAGLVVPLLLFLGASVRRARQVFIAVGILLVIGALLTRHDWLVMTTEALQTAAFIAAFFTALAALRDASSTSPSIQNCGRFLAAQPPGRRYAALTVGGHLFAILLNYGALVLLGTLAEASTAREPDPEIRRHRLRRMLLAIQRGLVSMLPWSPLAFSMAISTSLVPGANWSDAVAPCLVSGLLLAGLGWGLDTILKPRLSSPAPRRTDSPGSWVDLWPLLLLLALLAIVVTGIHLLTGIRSTGIVMLVVPLMSFAWIGMQNHGSRPMQRTGERIIAYVTRDLPEYRSELVLLLMAGFIGRLGSGLLVPLMAEAGFDLGGVPGWQILIALVWLIPLTGQLGMNPILSVSLMAPLLPAAAEMGVVPADIIVAITAGWALSGASSPYTATTVLISAIGKVSPAHVGIRWNGLYTLVSGIVLSLWVALVAYA